MDIKAYLERTLSVFALHRIKARAEIELQALVDDKLIHFGNCYYLRDAEGNRCGLICEWTTGEQAATETAEIHANNIPNPHTQRGDASA